MQIFSRDLAKTAAFAACAIHLATFSSVAESAMSAEELRIENRKLELEERKLELSTWNALITALGLAIPLLVGVATLAIQVRNTKRQDIMMFHAKAAEIVMNTQDPIGVRNRARALAALFPNNLPQDFAQSFAPNAYMGELPSEGGAEAKVEFFKIASSHLDSPEGCARLWRKLFPGDEWTERVTQNTNG